MLYIFISVIAFFHPSVKLDSGKKITIKGQGPPVLFSTGLFGTMPQFFYNNLINDIKKNFSIIEINGNNPIIKRDIYDIVNAISVDSIGYISHSSFNPEILENDKINSAVLIDPICVPTLSPLGFQPRDIYIKYPIQILYAEKLIKTDTPLPDWQKPNFYGDINNEIILDVGHPDILDNFWADFAKGLNLWGTAENKLVDFNSWTYSNSNTIKKTRMEYRKLIAKKCIEFIGRDI
tara:strand:+ start:1934 stop:2638 length:705 start_codon:yes stop_codon:yes gene_type:complete